VTAQALTYGPFRLLAMRVCLPRQFTVHLVETLNRIRYAIGHFEMVAESQINRESRRLIAATKASLHEPPVNFNFAHSLKSGGGEGEWRVVPTLLSGAERHRCKKSETQVTMGPIKMSSSTACTIFSRDSPASLMRPVA
jgi:hypothetical protein